MARLTEQAYTKGLTHGYNLAKAQYESIQKGEGMSKDLDELIYHTKNMVSMAQKNQDKESEAFFSGVLTYLLQYIKTFHKE